MPLKSRDIEAIIRNKGQERGIIYILSTLAEDNSVMRQEVAETAKQLIAISDILLKISNYNASTMHIMQEMSKLTKEDDIDDDDHFQGGNG